MHYAIRSYKESVKNNKENSQKMMNDNIELITTQMKASEDAYKIEDLELVLEIYDRGILK